MTYGGYGGSDYCYNCRNVQCNCKSLPVQQPQISPFQQQYDYVGALNKMGLGGKLDLSRFTLEELEAHIKERKSVELRSRITKLKAELEMLEKDLAYIEGKSEG